MKAKTKFIAVAAGFTLACSGVVAAHAAEITISVTGAKAETISSRAKAKATDTKADNFAAETRYKRGNASAATQKVKADAGNGSTATSPSGTTIATIQACTVNNNPFDANTCSVWKTL
ncbi:MAG: hypothetical protein LBG70_02810 [Bifidobacteriaceae bacterium]|jgi:hypothetical protein|nr:hypothetical protein [Bifidobacteriaceae bacterium]